MTQQQKAALGILAMFMAVGFTFVFCQLLGRTPEQTANAVIVAWAISGVVGVYKLR